MKLLACAFLTLMACTPKPAPGPSGPTTTPPPATGSGSGSDPKHEADCICTMQYDPVCGADGKTYSNSCVAACGKVEVKAPGACPK